MKNILLIFFFSSLLLHANEPIIAPDARIHPTSAQNFMVVSQDSLATDTAVKILEQGGNAADAAVALAYVLAVTQPKAGNLGGGGFALYYEAKSKKTYAIDFREIAPAKAHQNLFLNDKNEIVIGKSTSTPTSCGVPGTIAGLNFINAKFGSLPHETLINPAITFARDGFPISPGLAWDLAYLKDELGKIPEFQKRFYPEQKSLPEGTILKLPILANTLETLQKEGANSFYNGTISHKIAKFFQENNGIISAEDLKNYQVRLLEPVSGNYRNYTILSMPPPSSGGVHLIQMLNILEKFDLNKMGANSAASTHIMSETMKLAFADRSHFLGDPDFVKIPVTGITSKKYADTLRTKINLDKATTAQEISHGNPNAFESPDTTHFSIADSKGNVISFTYTINHSFGSRIYIPELGFILNNEMDDFSIKPNQPNSYGLIGGTANAIFPGKRPLSSMTPVIVFQNGKPWLVTGSPGGSHIINTTLQLLVNVIDHKMNIAEATMQPRFHHQWLPDKLFIEKGFNHDTINLLREKGHNIQPNNSIGCTETILIQENIFYGFADPRRIDGKAAGK